MQLDPLLSLSQNCIRGDAAPLSRPDHGIYLAGRYGACLVLERPPRTTVMGIIRYLTDLGIDVDLSVAFNTKNPNEEISRLEKKCRKLENNLASNKRQELQTATEGIREQIRRLVSEGAVPCTLQLIVTIWAESLDELRQQVALAKGAFVRMQGAVPYEAAFPISTCNYALAAAPGNLFPYEDLYQNLEDIHVTHLLPLDSVDTGDLQDAMLIVNGVRGNLVGIRLEGHAFVLGMTGSGKSMGVTRMVVESAPHYERTYVIDHGDAHGAWIRRMDDHVRVVIHAKNSHDTINYFDTLGSPLDSESLADAVGMAHVLAGPHENPDEDRIRIALIADAIETLYDAAFDEKAKACHEWLRALARKTLAHEQWLKDQKNSRTQLLDTFLEYREWTKTNPDIATQLSEGVPDEAIDRCLRDPDYSEILRAYGPAFYDPKDFPTHSQLQSLLKMESMGTGTQADRKGTLALLLEPWRASGPYGRLVDGPTTVTLDHTYVHIELGEIRDTALKRVATYLVTNRLMRLVTTLSRSIRKRVLVEECNAFGEFEDGPETIRHMFERFRKYSTSAICVAQSLQAIDSESLRKALVANTSQYFLFKQADRTELETFNESIQLPESAVASILAFPKPTAKDGAYFAYVRTGGTYPKVTLCRNIMNEEARRVADQSGASYQA